VEYIPFITSPKALQLVKTTYADAEVVRIPLDIAHKITVPQGIKLWIDPGVDGLDDLGIRRPKPSRNDENKEVSTSWYESMKVIPGFKQIADPGFAAQPKLSLAEEFVNRILDRCLAHKPLWITVPQLPVVDDSSRNRINRVLAKATAKWRVSRVFSGRLILPLIFTHSTQTQGKTQRNPKIEQAGRNYHEAHADGFWVVDSSFSDESGSKTLRNTRMTSLIQLHQELNNKISSRIRIAGPYWGLNLVLWARRFIEHPAIGVGSTYQYHLAGKHKPGSTPVSRVAVGPLRRRAVAAHTRLWLERTLKKLGNNHPAHGDLDAIYRKLTVLSDYDRAREQVAKFYKSWLDVLAETPPSGRSLALFQDLSTAYAMGKSLQEIPNEGPSRRPESIVEPLMLSCL
jgi:hypothetical protein